MHLQWDPCRKPSFHTFKTFSFFSLFLNFSFFFIPFPFYLCCGSGELPFIFLQLFFPHSSLLYFPPSYPFQSLFSTFSPPLSFLPIHYIFSSITSFCLTLEQKKHTYATNKEKKQQEIQHVPVSTAKEKGVPHQDNKRHKRKHSSY